MAKRLTRSDVEDAGSPAAVSGGRVQPPDEGQVARALPPEVDASRCRRTRAGVWLRVSTDVAARARSEGVALPWHERRARHALEQARGDEVFRAAARLMSLAF